MKKSKYSKNLDKNLNIIVKFKFISETQIEDLDESLTEFSDDSDEAKEWCLLYEKLYEFMKTISHDEETETLMDGSRGFLIQSEHDNTATIGIEFMDPNLISRKTFIGLGGILCEVAPRFKISVTVYVEQRMDFILIIGDTVYVNKIRPLKKLLKNGWFF